MSLCDDIQTILCDSRLDYEQKRKRLEMIVTKNEAVMLLGRNPSCEITLRDKIRGCRKVLYLVIEQQYFNQIISGCRL